MKHLAVICMIGVILLAGCAGPSGDPSAASGTGSSGETQGYRFKASGVEIAMHGDAAPVLEALGEPKEYFEAPSCAFQGVEKTYVYPSFSVYTYELDGSDHIASVVLMDDSVSTEEGVSIGDTAEKVASVYGEGYTASTGLYSYSRGTMKLNFILEGDAVTSIEYVALAGG